MSDARRTANCRFPGINHGAAPISYVIGNNHKYSALDTWVKVQNFQNPELLKNQNLKIIVRLQNIKNSKFNGQIP